MKTPKHIIKRIKGIAKIYKEDSKKSCNEKIFEEQNYNDCKENYKRLKENN